MADNQYDTNEWEDITEQVGGISADNVQYPNPTIGTPGVVQGNPLMNSPFLPGKTGIKVNPYYKTQYDANIKATTTKIPTRQIELLQDTLEMVRGYKNLSKRMESGKFKTGVLSPRFYPGAKGDLPMQLKGTKEEAAFKADTDKYFQKYRKVTTGVQAGYPELQWLAADYPKTTDRPDIYTQKAKSAVETNIENAKNMLATLENAGYDVSKFRQQLLEVEPTLKYIKMGTNSKGQRVGQLPDGSIEVIK